MSTASKIEWTTWNPVTGCDHCYALALVRRLKAMGSGKYRVDGDPRTSGPRLAVTVYAPSVWALHVHDLGPAGPGPCTAPDSWAPGAERAGFGEGLLLVADLGSGLAYGPAAACPVAWPGDPAATAGGCCTRCVPVAQATAPDATASQEGQPALAAA